MSGTELGAAGTLGSTTNKKLLGFASFEGVEISRLIANQIQILDWVYFWENGEKHKKEEEKDIWGMSPTSEDSNVPSRKQTGSRFRLLQSLDVYFPLVRCGVLRWDIAVILSSANLLSFPWHDFHCWEWTFWLPILKTGEKQTRQKFDKNHQYL